MAGNRKKSLMKGIIGFTTLAMLMFMTVVMVWLFFELFKYHLTLNVKDTYNFNRYQDTQMSLYDLYVNTANGCEGLPGQDCNIPLMFELSTLNFVSGARTDGLKIQVMGVYKTFIKDINYYLSIDLNKPVCLGTGGLKEGADCVGMPTYDLGLRYPIPLIPNGNFKNDPSLLLTGFDFQVKG